MMQDSQGYETKTNRVIVYFLLGGIFFVGLWLRWMQLSGSLEGDEIWVIKTAASPFPDFVRQLVKDWVHPPLFHFLVRGEVYIFGLSDLSGRFVSLILGVLSIPLIYWLGEEISGQKTGLVAAALLALSPVHIYHSLYGRHYSLYVFSVLLSMASFLKVYHEPDNRRYGVVYFISNVLLVYTHYFGWLIVFCQGLFVLVRRFTYFKLWAVLQTIVLLTYIPWVFLIAKLALVTVAENRIIPHIVWIPPPSLWDVAYTLTWFNGELQIPYQGRLGLMLLGGISLLSLIGISRDDKYGDAVLFLFSCVVLPFVLVFVVSHIIQPIWIPRAMLLSLPAFYLLIAIGSQRIEMKKAYLSLMFIPLLWMSLSSLSYLRNEHRLPHEQIARYLEGESESGMPLLVDGTYLMNPLYFYYKGQGSLYELWETNVSVVPVSHKESLPRILSRIKERENRLILVTFREPPSELSSSSAYRAVKRKDYNVLGQDMGQLRNMSIFFYEKNQDRS